MSYAPLVISFVEPRYSAEIKAKIATNRPFTYGVSRADTEPTSKEIALLSFTGRSIDYVAFAPETQAAETGRMSSTSES